MDNRQRIFFFLFRNQLLFSLLLAATGFTAPAWADVEAPRSSRSFLVNFQHIDLTDQNDRPFNPAELQHRVVLFNFIYTHCASTCPMQTRVLVQVMRSLPADVLSNVRIVSVSIDPAVDTPQQLKQFANTLQADLAGWIFLTGKPDQIVRLTQRLNLFDEGTTNPSTRPEAHRTALWLMDQQGRMLQRYDGDPPDRQRLARELIQLSRMPVTTP